MATPYPKIPHQPVGATIGRPSLVSPQMALKPCCAREKHRGCLSLWK